MYLQPLKMRQLNQNFWGLEVQKKTYIFPEDIFSLFFFSYP